MAWFRCPSLRVIVIAVVTISIIRMIIIIVITITITITITMTMTITVTITITIIIIIIGLRGYYQGCYCRVYTLTDRTVQGLLGIVSMTLVL